MSKLALEGLKVVDFTWAVVGTKTCSYLSENGATVVKVESITRIDVSRTLGPFKDGQTGVNRSAYFSTTNGGKLSLSLNLKLPQALDLARRLAAWADVAVESMRGGAMAELGLGYEDLAQVNPGLIMLSTCMYGQTGPHATHPGYGLILSSLSGFNHLIGWPDRGPTPIYGPYTDFVAPHFNLVALLAALEHKRRTGQGQYLDMSQFENGIHFLGPQVMDYTVNGREPARRGNRRPDAAPHGVFPCQGQDRWVALAVQDDREWAAMSEVAQRPEWLTDPRFADLAARLAHQDELEAEIGAWTAGQTAEELAERLQAAGVAAARVAHGADILADPQLHERGFFQEVDHPEIGPHRLRRQPFVLSETPGQVRRPPLLGEHNEQVCTQLLGLSDEEFVGLLAEGVLE